MSEQPTNDVMPTKSAVLAEIAKADKYRDDLIYEAKENLRNVLMTIRSKHRATLAGLASLLKCARDDEDRR